jgi:hypothetical protein
LLVNAQAVSTPAAHLKGVEDSLAQTRVVDGLRVKSLRHLVHNLTHKEIDLLALSEAIEKLSFPL